MIKCTRCDGSGWVCETHISRPWEGPNACGCGAAGAPCGRCNVPAAEGETPRVPEGFLVEIEKDGSRH
jgi:hypothetical protein